MTERQRQIARALALGESVQQAARRLSIRPQTVRAMLTILYAETGVGSQAGLVGWCVAHGVVTGAELQEVYGRDPVEGRPKRQPG